MIDNILLSWNNLFVFLLFLITLFFLIIYITNKFIEIIRSIKDNNIFIEKINKKEEELKDEKKDKNNKLTSILSTYEFTNNNKSLVLPIDKKVNNCIDKNWTLEDIDLNEYIFSSLKDKSKIFFY